MDKKNGLLVGIVVMIALLLGVLTFGQRPVGTADSVIIRVDGQEYARVPLGKRQTVTIRQEDGAENVVTVSENGAVMTSSTCDNQLCVQMGEVNRDNWEFRPNGAFIICLPNRVSVELAIE